MGGVKRSNQKESEGVRARRREESDCFITKPSLTWAAANTQTLQRPSLCGSLRVFVCTYSTKCLFYHGGISVHVCVCVCV